MTIRFPLTQQPLVQRGRSALTPNRWLHWEPPLPSDQPLRPLGPEWIWRGLRDVDLTDDNQVLTVLDRVGIVWGRYEDLRDDEVVPAEMPYPGRPPVDGSGGILTHMMDVVMYLETLRRIADTWADCAQSGQEPPTDFWYALGLGLAPFTLMMDVRAALDPATGPPIVDLYQAGCWQLAQTILHRPHVRRCHNENCRRVFFRRAPATDRGWATERVKYCSESCKDAQNQRDYRRRQPRRGLVI